MLTEAHDTARRQIWMRLRRSDAAVAPGDRCVVTLERLSITRLIGLIYLDTEAGPTLEDLRRAATEADGLPGRFIEALTGLRKTRDALWVHETASPYAPSERAPVIPTPSRNDRDAGIGRLERVVFAARALAGRGRHARAERLLRRAAVALAARGASTAAAAAACDLGDLQLGRGRPMPALEWFARAREWSGDPAITLRSLVGTGESFLDEGRLTDAEAALRTRSRRCLIPRRCRRDGSWLKRWRPAAISTQPGMR